MVNDYGLLLLGLLDQVIHIAVVMKNQVWSHIVGLEFGTYPFLFDLVPVPN